jgi:hypothetical protein
MGVDGNKMRIKVSIKIGIVWKWKCYALMLYSNKVFRCFLSPPYHETLDI